MKHLGLLAAFVLCSAVIGLVACARHVPQTTTEGQVFLVLKSGEAVKLALASVYLLDETQALNQAKKALAATADTLRTARADVDRDAEAIRRDRAESLRTRSDQRDKLLEEIEAMKQRGDFGPAYIVKTRQVAKIEDELADDDVGDATITKLRERQRDAYLRYPDEFVAALADAGDHMLFTRTDADGGFKLSFPDDGKRKALLIVAERQLEKVEQYVWFVWIDKMASDAGKLLFANHNDLRRGSAENVVNLSTYLATVPPPK